MTHGNNAEKISHTKFLQKAHIVYYILLQYLHVSSLPYKQWEGGGDNSLNPPQNKKAMTEQCVTVGQSPVTEMSLATPFNTVHIIHIYTDSGVMYKTGNGRNLRHYARGFSISRLHLSSTKFADNTKGHFFKIIN